MDVVLVQCCFHRPASFCYRGLRPIRLRTYPRSVPSALRAGSRECVLHENRFLALDRERVVSQPGMFCSTLRSRPLITLYSEDHVWVLNRPILGRPQAIQWLRLWPLVLGNDLVPHCSAHGSRESRLGFRVSSYPHRFSMVLNLAIL
jgi:hypothetical protein